MSLLFLWCSARFWSSFNILTTCCHLSLSSSTTCIPAFLFYFIFYFNLQVKGLFFSSWLHLTLLPPDGFEGQCAGEHAVVEAAIFLHQLQVFTVIFIIGSVLQNQSFFSGWSSRKCRSCSVSDTNQEAQLSQHSCTAEYCLEQP